MIEKNTLTYEEWVDIINSVGWQVPSKRLLIKSLSNSITVKYIIDKKTVAMARFVTDYGYIGLIADVIVKPEYQRKNIGTKLINELLNIIRQDLEEDEAIMVQLLSAQGKKNFYKKFGFKEEKEITVKITCSYNDLHNILIKQNFKIKEKYQVNDIYMIGANININKLSELEILKKCILVRDIIDIDKQLLYKNKEYDKKGNIIKQSKIKCPIIDIEKGIKFMEAINYKKLMELKDNIIVYCNDKIELNIQLVNNKYIFLEMEDKPEYINKIYNSTEEIITDLNKYNIPYEKGNYFVKKAQIILKETGIANKEK